MPRLADISVEREDQAKSRRVHRPAKGMTLEEVGRLVGLHKERVRQIESEALAKMRDAFEKLDSGEMEVADLEWLADCNKAHA